MLTKIIKYSLTGFIFSFVYIHTSSAAAVPVEEAEASWTSPQFKKTIRRPSHMQTYNKRKRPRRVRPGGRVF